jgi:hypothetical protein
MSVYDDINFAYDPRLQSGQIIPRPLNDSSVVEPVDVSVILEETGGDSGKRRVDAATDFEFFAKFPSTTVFSTGYMLLVDGVYYLIMAIEKKMYQQAVAYYRASLYECNATVNIVSFNDATNVYDTVNDTAIPCLIAPGGGSVGEDRSYVIPGYSGRKNAYRLFIQAYQELLPGDKFLQDQDGRRWRLSKDFDYWLSNGVIRTMIVPES